MNEAEHATLKQTIYGRIQRLATAPLDRLAAEAGLLYTENAQCNAFHPVNELQGCAQIVEELWRPLRAAFPDGERRDEIAISGEFNGAAFVAFLGHYQGTFAAPFHGIPPSRAITYLRYGDIHRIEGGKIQHSCVILDLLDLMRQSGCWPIAPSLGAEGRWPSPKTQDGLRLDRTHGARSAKSLEIVLAMHAALRRFDGKSLGSMDHARYWTHDFMWYGPSGIGATRGLEGFRAHHQIPFLRAFADRRGSSHYVRLGDGPYVVTSGWPSVTATHSGSDWLGLPPTGRRVGMRVMDFYRLDGELIAENWVPIDILDILRQLGVDVIARMRHLTGSPRQSL